MEQSSGQRARLTLMRPHASKILSQAWLRRSLFYVLLLAIWQGIANSGLWPSYIAPGPLDVLGTLSDGVLHGPYLMAALISLQRLAIGYALSLLLGILLGLLIASSRLAEQTLGSLILGLQALPSVCWIPLAILWLGLSEQAIIFVVVMGALFSITLGVEAGIRQTPPIYLKAARTLGTHGLALARDVLLPAALPAMLTGLKQGWTFAWRSLMAGELLFYSLSLGNLLQAGRDLNDASQVIAVMLMIMVIGLIIDRALFAPLERNLRQRWGLL